MQDFATYPSLNNKSVIVTGGANGIGYEIVKAFAQQGATVGFLDKDVDTANTVVKNLRAETGSEIYFSACDLRDIEALRSALKALTKRIGTPTVLVNNAAHDDRHDWKDVTSEYWDERFNTNLRHQFFAIQALAPGMIKVGGGSIINLGSNSWFEAGGGFPAYASAKSAVHGLTRTMARDLGEHRIRVNAVVPGWIMTERQKDLWVTDEGLKGQLNRQCLPDLVEPVYVARMVTFLASDDSAMCTSQNYIVDGGTI